MKNFLKTVLGFVAITVGLTSVARAESPFDELITLLSKTDGAMEIGKCKVWLSSSDSEAQVFDLNITVDNSNTILEMSSPDLTGGRSIVTKESFGFTYRESDIIGWLVLDVKQDALQNVSAITIYKTTALGKVYHTEVSCGL